MDARGQASSINRSSHAVGRGTGGASASGGEHHPENDRAERQDCAESSLSLLKLANVPRSGGSNPAAAYAAFCSFQNPVISYRLQEPHSSSSCFSLIILTPSFCAFSSFEPASSPATT